MNEVRNSPKNGQQKNGHQPNLLKWFVQNDSVPCLTVTDGRYEQGDTAVTGKFPWKKGDP